MKKKKKPNPYKFVAHDGSENGGALYIFGDIGDDQADTSIAAIEVIAQMEVISGDLAVYLNTHGGSVAEGIAIYNALKQRQASSVVATYVQGVAYSIGNLIAQAATPGRRYMARLSMGMVHAPAGITFGNAKDHRDQADSLDKHGAIMMMAYTDHGIAAEVAAGWLSNGADHYFTPEEAIAEGLADRITAPVPNAIASARAFAIERKPTIKRQPAAESEEGEKMEEERKRIAAEAKAKAEAEAKAKAEVTAAAKTAAIDAVSKERNRIEAIQSSAAPYVAIAGIPEIVTAAISGGKSPETFASDLLAAVGKAAPSPVSAAGFSVEMGQDARDKFRAGASVAVAVRAGTVKRTEARGNEFVGLSMVELARESARRSGIDAGGTKMELIGRVLAAGSHGTSDFAYILEDAAEKSMLIGFEANPESYQQWTQDGQAPDFKPVRRVDLDLFPSLREVRAGAEYKHATVGDRGESVIVATYGEIFAITRQALVNDDLDAFTRVPRYMGEAANRTIGDLVYAVLTSNPAMSDGNPLFDASHSNVITPAGPPTSDNVAAMRAAMMRQKSSGKPAGGLNIRLGYVLVPAALEDTALKTATSEYVAGSDAGRLERNTQAGRFEVVSDARLDEASASKWYGAGINTDTVEVTWLEGLRIPHIESQDGWTIDGAEFKVRIDAGAKAIAWQGLASNAG